MTNLKLALVALFAGTALLLAPVAVSAQNQDLLCEGVNLGGGTGSEQGTDCGSPEEAREGFERVIFTIIDVFSLVVGAVSVIMIIIGGLRYITSAGDPGNVASAKNTILYAVVGLIIVILAQTIVKYVITLVTGD